MKCNRASAAGDLPEPLCEKELVAFLLSVCERPSFPSSGMGPRFEEAARKQAEVQPKGHSASATTDTDQGKVTPSYCLG